MLGQLLGIALEEIEKALVPFDVVKARTLAVHLMRQAAGRKDRDLQILGIAFDRAPKRLAQLDRIGARWASAIAARPSAAAPACTGHSGSCGHSMDSGEKQP